MPSLSEHQSGEFFKLIYIGDSGTGKSGSLVSLMNEYDLRFLDMDNGLDVVRQFAQKECPDRLASVEYVTYRDKVRMGPSGPIIKPTAWVDSLKALTKWPVDESDPAEWGSKKVLVIDSGSSWGRSAFNWAKGLNPTAKDPRQWYFTAQQSFEDAIALLTSEQFNTNVILISHVTYNELQDGTTKGYATAVGKALGPIISKYFNTLLLAEATGSGKHTRRKIKTVPTGIIDLKNPAPFKVESEYDLSTGMAEIVRELKAL